jgi:hypothetical protein
MYYNPYIDEVTTDKRAGSIPLKITEEGTSSQNTAFSNGVQFAWDNTSIGLFKTCPRKYYFTIVEGYVPKSMAPPLAFGIHLHTLLQTWHKLIATVDRHTALTRVVRLAGLLGETLPSGDTARTKETLVRAVVWYLDQFWEDKAETITLPNKAPAVEYHFRLPFMNHAGLGVFLCGHIDRMVKWQGKAYVCDYKTSKYPLDGKFFDKFKPSTQMPLYVTASHLVADTLHDLPSADGVIIDGIQLGVNFCRYARNVVHFSLEEINEYIESLQYWIRLAMDTSRAGFFPPNEESCDKYGGCHFRDICSKPPARREAYLKGNFKTQVWNPLTSRD